MRRSRWARSVAGMVAAACTAGVAVAATEYSFREATQESGITGVHSVSWGAVWEDYDGDRDPDLFANRHYLPARLFVNGAGQYVRHAEDFTELPGYNPQDDGPMDRHSCAWGEVNGDRVPELLCIQGADKGTGSGPNQLIFQVGARFVDRASRWRIARPRSRGRTLNWLDYDRDGDLDLFLGNAYRKGYPNKLFRNDRDRFRPVRASGLELLRHTTSSTWSDWDNDGDPDLLVTFKRHRSVAYENRRGKFRSVDLGVVTGRRWTSASWGDFNGDGRTDVHLISPRSSVVARNLGGRFRKVHAIGLSQGRASTWFDVDNDGDLDLFLVQGERDGVNRPNLLLVRRARGFVRLRSAKWAGSRAGNGDSVVAADSDLDGDTDLFVTNGHRDGIAVKSQPELLINDTVGGRSISLRLVGRRFNPWGMGSRIRVRAGDKIYRREITDGINYRSQSGVSVINLGIGSARGARIKVSWPGGGRDCRWAAAGSLVTIRRGSSSC
ncbi:MAG: hypothetical protein GEU78_09085 [Actinobacteria bacterium]|nr:hypothetical protein [Actinomycetota bacterium]